MHTTVTDTVSIRNSASYNHRPEHTGTTLHAHTG